MSSQKNTLLNYFGKSPAAKPSPNASPAPRTPKTPKVVDSPSRTPKRALASGARVDVKNIDSPKSTKSVVREHLVAASPRTRVQRKLLDTAALSPNTYEPHFLRKILSSPNKKLGTPLKNKENARRTVMSPVFKALQEHEESASSFSSEDIAVESSNVGVPSSPVKCSLRKPVRNLNKGFFNSPSKGAGKEAFYEKVLKNTEEFPEPTSETNADVCSFFGQYVASEMRRLNSDKAVRSLKLKIMKSIVEVQSEQEAKAST